MLVTSSLLAICSSNWIMLWMGLEINTLAICVMMSKENSKIMKNNNSTFLYLCVQIMTSSMIIISLFQESLSATVLLTIATLMKMGGWPLHSWYMSLISKMSMKQNPLLLVMTWQKIIPVVMIASMNAEKLSGYWIISLALLSLMVPLSSLKPNISMKSLLVVSSLNNNSWLLMSTLSSMKVLSSFLFLYSLSLMMFFNLVKKMKKKNMAKNTSFVLVTLVVANMSGLPPFSMFWAKLMVLKTLLSSTIMILAVTLMILCACYLLYFYLLMVNNEMIKSPKKSMNPSKGLESSKPLILTTLSLSALSALL